MYPLTFSNCASATAACNSVMRNTVANWGGDSPNAIMLRMRRSNSSSSVNAMPPSPVVMCFPWQRLKTPMWPQVPAYLPL